jgi:BON domain
MRIRLTLWQSVIAFGVVSALSLPVSAFGQTTLPGASDMKNAPSGSTSSEQSGNRSSSMRQDEAMTETDRTLNQRIRQALGTDLTLAVASQNVHLRTENGEVTLHGSVATDKEKVVMATKVQQLTGVRKVTNALEVVPNTTRPTSPHDALPE